MNCGTGDFFGLPTIRLGDQLGFHSSLRLECLAGGGPRIVRLSLADSPLNFLAESPNVHWSTPNGEYFLYGGHRLWIAPEDIALSSMPDGEGLETTLLVDGICLSQPPDLLAGIRKTMSIHFVPDRPMLTIEHTLESLGTRSIEIAPWAITQLPLGGVLNLPQPQLEADGNKLQPNRRLVLWPYTHWDDPRLHLNDDRITLQALPDEEPAKWGYLNSHGWASYNWQGYCFTKRFPKPQPGTYPDVGCNVEFFIKDQYLELETLGPLVNLQPGELVTHWETWEIQPQGVKN